MPYQVFDSGKPADTSGHPSLKGACWVNSKFNTFEEAHSYAVDYVGRCFSSCVPDKPDVVSVYYSPDCTIEIRTIEEKIEFSPAMIKVLEKSWISWTQDSKAPSTWEGFLSHIPVTSK